MDDHEAIAQLQRGDIAGLAHLVQHYEAPAVRAAYLVVRDRPLAEDVVQTAFLHVYQAIHQFDPTRPFGPWFLQSVVHRAVRVAARSDRWMAHAADASEVLLHIADPRPGLDDLLETAETNAVIWSALGQLPPEQRAVIVLRYYLDLSELVSVLRAYAEQAVPTAPGLWPAIQARVQAVPARPPAVRPGPRRIVRWPALPALSRRVRVGALSVGLLLGLGVWLGGHLIPQPAAAADLLRRATAANVFVPAGKVRHIVTSHSLGAASTAPGWTDEVWLTAGPQHLLLWKPAAQPGPGHTLPTFLQGRAQLIDAQAVWDFALQDHQVYKRPYSPGAVAAQLPNQAVVEELLKQPATRIVGTTVLDGRPVVVVAGHVGTIVSGSPLDIAEGKTPGYRTAEHDYQLWIDSQTYQIVQEQHYIQPPGPGAASTPVDVSTTRITRDELLDLTAVPPDLFQFRLPTGATLVDATRGRPPPTAVPPHSGWYEFTSAAGRFAILMPRTPDQGLTDTGAYTTLMWGAKVGSVSYVVRYTDYPAGVLQQEGAEKWLDLERDGVVATSQGTLQAEHPVTRNGHPGRDLSSVDSDGRARRTQLYLVGNRLYKITTVGPPGAATAEIGRFFNSFQLLGP